MDSIRTEHASFPELFVAGALRLCNSGIQRDSYGIDEEGLAL